jgi:phospholipase A2
LRRPLVKKISLLLLLVNTLTFANSNHDVYRTRQLKHEIIQLEKTRFSLGDVWGGTQDLFQDFADGLMGGLGYLGDAASTGKDFIMSPIRESYNVQNPYKSTPSKIRVGTDLSREERIFLAQRRNKVAYSLKKHFDIELSKGQDLRVAVCGSGGGYRAMIYTLGAFMGAKNIGLLDSSTYVAGLSGSTWTIGAWLAQGVELSKLKEVLSEGVKSGDSGSKMVNFISDYNEIDKVVNNTISRLVFKQPLSIVAIWGALIANSILADLAGQRQSVNLSSQRSTVAYGKYPLPIYTAVEPLDHLDDPTNPDYRWFEFTPYEVGSAELGAFVPSWGFGRKYKNGQARGFKIGGDLQYEPEMPFGYQMGIFGSAFEIDLHEFMSNMQDVMKEKPLACKALTWIASRTDGDKRLMPAEIRNLVYKLDGHAEADNKHTTLIDAGLCFNVPLPPLLRSERAIDVIFVVDSSASVEGACELVKAEEFARKRGLKFPKIDYTNIDKNTLNVFSDDDSSVPVIVYMPRINDTDLPQIQADPLLKDFDPDTCVSDSFCSTFNFGYSPRQFEQLCKLGQYNVELNKDKIQQVLKQVLARKQ